MQDIVFTASQRLANVAAQPPSDGQASVRSVRVEGDTSTETDNPWFVVCAVQVRRDDVDVMTARARFLGEEVHVLADPSNVRVVVLLRHERDAERPEPRHARLERHVVGGSCEPLRHDQNSNWPPACPNTQQRTL